MATHRASKAEKAQRIARLVRMISNGAVTSDLLEFARCEWQVSTSQAHAYIAEAREVVIADIDQDRRLVVAEMMHVCRMVIKDGMKGGNLNAVLGAINAIARLGGLNVKPGP